MGVLKGTITTRRYRVLGDLPGDFRDRYRESLVGHAFRAAASRTYAEEVVGWVEIGNLLDTRFEDLDHWMMDSYVVLGLRVNKKSVPGTLLRAHVAKAAREWCEAEGRTRCPAKVKAELREKLEDDLLARSLPKVSVYELVWNLDEGWLAFHNTSDRVNDRMRTLFFRTFGHRLLPDSPLDILGSTAPEHVEALVSTGGLDYRVEGA